MQSNTKLSIFLSLILRHRPEVVNLTLDENGWADVDQLILGMNANNSPIDIKVLSAIVETDDKNRYSFNEDKTKIRANQGHSVKVDLGLTPIQPPDTLYHGTPIINLKSIRDNGLRKRKRNHVHLSEDIDLAKVVGSRRGESTVLVIDAKKMHQDGHKFYQSKNKVWLCELVPINYIREGI